MKNLKDINLLDIGNKYQLAGAIWAGPDDSLVCMFPNEDINLPQETLVMTQEEWQTFLKQTNLLETEVLAKSSDGTLAKIILRKSQRQIDQAVSWRVWKRDSYKCRYCGANDMPLTVDHLITWESGGPSTEVNLLSSCKKCNKVRGNMSYADWLKHPRYRQVSANLDLSTRAANEAVLATLGSIPLMLHVKSR